MLNRQNLKISVFLQIAINLSQLATCSRRNVGCVILDKYDRIIATGYNGVAKSSKHCIDNNCAGSQCESNTNLDKCEAIHAEQNALLQCKDINEIAQIICTTSPCMHCAKLISNTSCKKVIYLDKYDENAIEYLKSKNIEIEEWEKIND